VTIPLAMLATRGGLRLIERARRSSRPALAPLATAGCGLVVLLFTAPGLREFGISVSDTFPGDQPPVAIRGGEREAMRWLASAPDGGVFTTAGVGLAVPALSGQDVWVAHFTWSPAYRERATLAEQAVSGQLPDERARAVVTGSGARYVLVPCGASPNLARALGPISAGSRDFGCARVVTVR
jgi:hypothetical protein